MGKLHWMDVSDLSFNSLLLLEKMQVDYLDKLNMPEEDLAVALQANPAVEWYIRNRSERLNSWLNNILEKYSDQNCSLSR